VLLPLFISTKWIVEILVMTWMSSVFFRYSLKVKVFNVGIHFLLRRTLIPNEQNVSLNAINIIFFKIIRLKDFFCPGKVLKMIDDDR
jgi:hypothetical protein